MKIVVVAVRVRRRISSALKLNLLFIKANKYSIFKKNLVGEGIFAISLHQMPKLAFINDQKKINLLFKEYI